jgi:hypothetical protein
MGLSDRVIERSREIMRSMGLSRFVEPAMKCFPARAGEFEGAVGKLYSAHEGRVGIKWDHYFRVYDRHFAQFRGQAIRFLEIGVSQGGSLQIWRKYFGQDATIFGVDVDPRCAIIDSPPSIHVRIGSQADADFMRSVVAEMGGIDIVLDDGSHRVSHQRASFEVLFPLLNENGLYVVEDMHSNYWRGQYEGGWRRRSTFLEQMKDLIDDLHGWWHKRPQRLAGAHQIIEGIHFYDSIVVIEKRPKLSPAMSTVGQPSF